MKKNIKWIIIFILIALIIETGVYCYNSITNSLFKKYNFIENKTIDLDMSNAILEEESKEYEVLKLKSPKDIKIYNFKFTLKEEYSSNLYVRIRTDYGEKLLPKSNYPSTEFKTYYKEGITTEKLEIVFPKDSVKVEDISSIQLNTNLDYVVEDNTFSFTRCVVYFIIQLLIYVLIVTRKEIYQKINNISLEKLFGGAVLIFGIIYTFINVPLIRYDEHAHFWRAYELSQGKLKTDPENEFPKSIVNLFFRDDGTYPNREFNYNTLATKLQENLNAEDTIAFPAGVTGGYSVLNYISTLFGVLIARVIGLSPVLIFYVGRLFNVFLYSILIYFAVKIVPSKKYKKIIGIISLFPMALNLAASYSPDTVINGFTMLAIAYVLKLKFDENIKQINVKHILIFSCLALIPTICKVVYVFLFGFIFFIQKDKFNKKYSRALYFVLQLLGIVVLYYLFNVWLRGDVPQPIEKNPIEQIIYCISNPIRCVKIFIYTLSIYSTDYLTQLVGGWNTPTILSIVLAIVLLAVIFEKDEEDTKYKFTKIEQVVLIIISILEFLSVFVALYIDWSTAQCNYIIGVQGRYFIPILPIFSLGINKDLLKIDIKSKKVKFVLLILTIYIISIIYSVYTFMS